MLTCLFKNGLRQGCTMVTLFNIYFNTMVARWRVHSEVAGVTVLYKHGRRLVGGRTVKSRLEGYRLQSLGFQMILHCMLHPKLHLSLLDGALLSFWANY